MRILYKLTWVLVVGILTLTTTAQLQAQNSVEITIFRDPDSLTIFVPGEDLVSLQGLQFQVENDEEVTSYLLQAYNDLTFMNFNRLQAPFCIRLVRYETRPPTPQECAGTTITTQILPDANVFWYDNDLFVEHLVSIQGASDNPGICPQQASCRLTFIPFREPPDGINIEADIDNREILVLVTQFEQLSGNPIEPHREWEFTINRAIQELGDQGNARVLYIPRVIFDHDAARELSEEYLATLVIWGQVRGAALESNYTITERWSNIGTEPEQTAIIGSLEELQLFVSPGGDTEFVINFLIGQLFFFEQNYSEALPYFERAIAEAPVGRELDMGLAGVYFYAGYVYQEFERTDLSIQAYTIAIEIDTDYAEAYNNRGVALYDQRDLEMAIIDFDRAIALNGEVAEAYNNRGVARSNQGDLARAIADYDRAIELNGEFAEAYNNRGVARRALGDLAGAIGDYDRAIELNGEYATAYNNRGNARRALGDLAGAIGDYDRAIELNGGYATAYHNRGVALYDQRDLEMAIIDFDRALAINPDYVSAYWGLGNTYYDLERFEESLDSYQRYIELAGESNAPEGMIDRVRELEAQLTATPPG